MLAFSENLHIDLGVAIERREGLDTTSDREAISAQDIGFLDVSTDEDSERGVASDATTDFGDEGDDTLSERSRTISSAGIERGKSFDDVSGEEMIDRDNEENDEIIDRDDVEDETIDCDETNFDFFA